jgi:hypothetical protein
MSDVGDAINEARTAVNTEAAAEALTDLCDIYQLGMVDDGHSGQTEKETVVAQNVPVQVSQAAPGGNTVVSGGVTYTGTHRLKFGWNSTNVGINPKQKIYVHARGNEGQMIFEQPVREKGSTSPWLFVAAKLTTGFRSPPNV